MRIKFGKLLLTRQDISRAEQIYMDLFVNTGVAGGVVIWTKVFETLLAEEGYEIVKKKETHDGSEENG